MCWDSNTRPLEHESPPMTTRPGLPPTYPFLGILLKVIQFFLKTQRQIDRHFKKIGPPRTLFIIFAFLKNKNYVNERVQL